MFIGIQSNWTWDEVAGQYYWHRFFSSQPDLNFENPKVREEMLKVLAKPVIYLSLLTVGHHYLDHAILA